MMPQGDSARHALLRCGAARWAPRRPTSAGSCLVSIANRMTTAAYRPLGPIDGGAVHSFGDSSIGLVKLKHRPTLPDQGRGSEPQHCPKPQDRAATQRQFLWRCPKSAAARPLYATAQLNSNPLTASCIEVHWKSSQGAGKSNALWERGGLTAPQCNL